MSTVEEIRRLFDAAGCRGQVCVRSGNGSAEIALDPHLPAVAASVIKVLIAVEVERQLAEGRLDRREPVVLSARERTPGPVGFSLYDDDVAVSLGDLLVPMLTISDNVAADALLARVGIDACNATAARLGLTSTVVVSDLRTMIDGLGRAAGFTDWDALTHWFLQPPPQADSDAVTARLRTSPALDPAFATRTTCHDMCLLLEAIWTGRAADPAGCRRIRRLMEAQLTRHRLAAAFPPPARVAAKSGGLVGVIRNEIGVVTHPDGQWWTVAVFTQAVRPGVEDDAVNAVIGQVAAVAVKALDRA